MSAGPKPTLPSLDLPATAATWAEFRPDAILLEVHVQPRSSHDRIVGEHGGRLKIQVTAAPVDDAANRAVEAIVSRVFDVPRSAVRVVAGHRGRRKRLAVTGASTLPAAIGG